MKKEFIGTNVGKRVQLRARAIHLSDNDAEIDEADDDWLILAYKDRLLTLENTRTGSSISLHDDAVHSFTHNVSRGRDFGFLKMTVQLYIRGTDVTFEPVTRPGERLPPKPQSLLSEAYLEATLLFHDWKNLFISTRGSWWDLPTADGDEFVDVWDLMENRWLPDYTEENRGRYAHLFGSGIERLRAGIDRLLTVFGHVLPTDYQAELVCASRRLETEHVAYGMIKTHGLGLGQLLQSPSDEAHAFKVRFTEVIRILRNCDREANRRRDLLKRPTE